MCGLGPLGQMALRLPGKPQILPGLVTRSWPVPGSQATLQGGRQLGTGIPLSMGSEPTELTKPLLPHPTSGSCEQCSCTLPSCLFCTGDSNVLPVLLMSYSLPPLGRSSPQ